MKSKITIILLFFSCSVIGQNKIEGSYYAKLKVFRPSLKFKFYLQMDSFKFGVAPFVYQNKYYLIDSLGKILTPNGYDGMRNGQEGIFQISTKTGYGFIDSTGIEIVPPIYGYYTRDFQDGMAIIKKGDQSAAVNKKGRITVSFRNGFISDFSHGLAFVDDDNNTFKGTVYFIDKEGNKVFNEEFVNPDIEGYDEFGLIRVSKTFYHSKGLIDTKGKHLLPFTYTDISVIKDSEKPNNYFIITVKYISNTDSYESVLYNSTLKPIVSSDILIGRECHDGLISFTRKVSSNKYVTGFIDSTGKELFGVFDVATNFNNGISVVTKNNKWGGIDRKGNVVIPFQFDRIYGFYQKGRSVAVINNKYGIIDSVGNVIVPFMYDSEYDVVYIKNETIRFKENGKYGLYDRNGKIIVAADYEEIDYLISYQDISPNGKYAIPYLQFTKNKKVGILDETGKIIIEAKYDKLLFINILAELYCFNKNGKQVFVDYNGNEISE